MPLFEFTLCAIWRDDASSKKTAVLAVLPKPVSFLHVAYNLLPAAYYQPCSFSVVTWGGVAKVYMDDGTGSTVVPIVRRDGVAAISVRLQHDVNISLDGILELLHHRVDVTVTENKDAVPNSFRNKRPANIVVVGEEGIPDSPEDVTLTTTIAEQVFEDEQEEVRGNDPSMGKPSKGQKRQSTQVNSTTAIQPEAPAGLAISVPAAFSAASSDVINRHCTALIATAASQISPRERGGSEKVKTSNKGGAGKTASQKGSDDSRPKSGDKQGGKDKKGARGKKSDKDELALTFLMDFFFSGAEELEETTPLRAESGSLVQLRAVLGAPGFLPAGHRVALNPLVVHLKRLDGLPSLPAGFREPAAPGSGARAARRSADRLGSGRSVTSRDDRAHSPPAGPTQSPPVFFAMVHMPDGQVYQTQDLSYSHQVSLDELKVIFSGLLDRECLWQRLQTEPLLVQLLWRHTTPLVSNRPFNRMEIDKHIHDPNLVNIIKKSGNPFAVQNPQPTKFAEVKVDLSALTRGARLLSLEVPLTTQPPERLSTAGGDIARGTCPPPLSPLQLLQADCQLRLSVSLAVPLDMLPRPLPARCPYGRLLAVLSPAALQQSGVLGLIQRLNEAAAAAAAAGGTDGGDSPRRPGDASTPGVSGFLLRQRHSQLLFAEGRADADLARVAAALRALPRRLCRLLEHSGLLFAERLYQRQPPFRVLEGGRLRALLVTARFYASERRQEPARALRGVGGCLRSQWLSVVLREGLLPSDTGLVGLHQLMAA